MAKQKPAIISSGRLVVLPPGDDLDVVGSVFVYAPFIVSSIGNKYNLFSTLYADYQRISGPKTIAFSLENDPSYPSSITIPAGTYDFGDAVFVFNDEKDFAPGIEFSRLGPTIVITGNTTFTRFPKKVKDLNVLFRHTSGALTTISGNATIDMDGATLNHDSDSPVFNFGANSVVFFRCRQTVFTGYTGTGKFFDYGSETYVIIVLLSTYDSCIYDVPDVLSNGTGSEGSVLAIVYDKTTLGTPDIVNGFGSPLLRFAIDDVLENKIREGTHTTDFTVDFKTDHNWKVILGVHAPANPYVITFLNHTDYVGKFVLLLQANSETVSSWVNVKLPTAGAPTLSTGGLWDRLEFWCDKTDLFLTNVQLGYSL